MLFMKIIAVYSENHTEHTNTMHEHNAEFLNAKVDGTHSFFFNLVCQAIGTAATPGLLCQPRVIVKMIVEKQMECRLAEETEVLGENLPQPHFCPSQNPT
jgi:hypothetical protein